MSLELSMSVSMGSLLGLMFSDSTPSLLTGLGLLPVSSLYLFCLGRPVLHALYTLSTTNVSRFTDYAPLSLSSLPSLMLLDSTAVSASELSTRSYVPGLHPISATVSR